MATDCAMLRVEEEGENGDDEIELSLELSIGRSHKKSKAVNKISTDSCVKDAGDDRSLSRSGTSEIILTGYRGCEGGMDVQSKREIQALRRQEARKKREEKLKKKGCVNGEEKAWLESRQLEVRARDRERRENEDGVVGGNKREKIIDNVGNGEIKDLNLALNTGSSVPVVPMQFLDSTFRNGGVYPLCVRAPDGGGNVNRTEEKALDCRSFRPYNQGNRNTTLNDDGTDNGSGGCSSSAVSDYQSSSRQGGGGGGSSSDSGRSHNSSHSKPQKQLLKNFNTASAPIQQSKHGASSSSSLTPVKPNQPIPIANSAKQHIEADHRPQTETNEILSLPQMPCVSATGNGPNGKTINGFLYRYTKSEVTIVCVCHGSSFSPAGFVEHAGGIDVVHPLKHITVVPSAFG
ncbi:hypothetical protein LguiA_011746 [Lonicera macranthoides]